MNKSFLRRLCQKKFALTPQNFPRTETSPTPPLMFSPPTGKLSSPPPLPRWFGAFSRTLRCFTWSPKSETPIQNRAKNSLKLTPQWNSPHAFPHFSPPAGQSFESEPSSGCSPEIFFAQLPRPVGCWEARRPCQSEILSRLHSGPLSLHFLRFFKEHESVVQLHVLSWKLFIR